MRGKRNVVIDTTLIEVPPSFPGAGKVSRQVKVQSKARRPKATKATVYGFKVWTRMDAATGLVLAMCMDTAEKPENLHVRALIEQAQANLGTSAHIGHVVLDRGFLDGDLLHGLGAAYNVQWVVPAKSNMDVTAEARQRVTEALQRAALQRAALPAAAGAAAEASLDTARRLAGSSKPTDGIRFFERRSDPGKDPLVVAQVDRLECTDFYGPGGSDSSRLASKTFVPTPLYATVALLLYRGLAAHTEAQERKEEDAEDKRAPRLGILRYRRLIEMRNCDKVIVVAEGCYTLMEFRELMRYAGFGTA